MTQSGIEQICAESQSFSAGSQSTAGALVGGHREEEPSVTKTRGLQVIRSHQCILFSRYKRLFLKTKPSSDSLKPSNFYSSSVKDGISLKKFTYSEENTHWSTKLFQEGIWV